MLHQHVFGAQLIVAIPDVSLQAQLHVPLMREHNVVKNIKHWCTLHTGTSCGAGALRCWILTFFVSLEQNHGEPNLSCVHASLVHMGLPQERTECINPAASEQEISIRSLGYSICCWWKKRDKASLAVRNLQHWEKERLRLRKPLAWKVDGSFLSSKKSSSKDHYPQSHHSKVVIQIHP